MTASDPNYFRSGVMTWKEFRDKGYEGSYRPTPDDWHETQDVVSSRKKRSTFQSRSIREILNKIQFTLGGDVDCEQMDKSVYCNGPLPPGYTFVVKVFACTAGGCKQSDTGIVIITLGEGKYLSPAPHCFPCPSN
ncbi:uncharacterized protein LOC112566744 [Pomacea canaliculata]|uniref:uncharacterized protein LOC112566744 n=1 Tax=Pomacea canaliculata TaxID=400727 RepID=UPI000D727CCC|nr:uncharacterized protein LOC112566744 [Pomacea canaliculata]